MALLLKRMGSSLTRKMVGHLPDPFGRRNKNGGLTLKGTLSLALEEVEPLIRMEVQKLGEVGRWLKKLEN